MTPLAPLITRFLCDYMPRQRGYSPHSCEAYAISFKLLFEFAAKRTRTRPSQLSIEQLDAPLIVDFLAHIERERGNSAATRNLRLAADQSVHALRRAPDSLGARADRPDRGNPGQAPRPEAGPLSDDGGGASDFERARSWDAVGHEGSGNDAPLLRRRLARLRAGQRSGRERLARAYTPA